MLHVHPIHDFSELLLAILVCYCSHPVDTTRYVFTLGKVEPPDHQAINEVNSTNSGWVSTRSTWGGSPVIDPVTNSTHVFAAVMGDGCGLAAWELDSAVLHAVSPHYDGGPCSVTGSGPVVDGYAHNPEVVAVPSANRWLMFTLGGENKSAAVPCRNGVPTRSWGGSGPPPWLSTVRVHTATNLNGPWVPLRNTTTGASAVVANGRNANPTAWVDPVTGEVTLLHGEFTDPGHRRVYVVSRAPNWSGPYMRLGVLSSALNPPTNCSTNASSPWYACPCTNEDPHLFKVNGRWRLLFHQYTRGLAHGMGCPAASDPLAGPDPSLAVVGGYGESVSDDILGDWHYDYFGVAAYGMQPQWKSNNSGGYLLRRERPKLLFDSKGIPRWLFNGVGLAVANGTLGPGDRNTFTMSTPIIHSHF
eukprot:m.274365 g.274365  ORF g.274365 m.274365 type:complete len:417 (+) comp16287_c0_seq3:90-1340(+)